MKILRTTTHGLGLLVLLFAPLVSAQGQTPLLEDTTSVVITPQQRVQLESLSRELEERHRRQLDSALFLAHIKDWPVHTKLPDGGVIELIGLHPGGMPRYYITHNEGSAKTISTNKVWPGGSGGFSLTGSGQVLGEWDQGRVRREHQEFTPSGGTSRVTQPDNAATNSDHSTHVAGTMIAAGVQTGARGMSYQANLNAYDWFSDDAEMAAAAATGLNVSNHSYGVPAGWEWNFRDDGQWAWIGDPNVSTTEDYTFGYYDGAAARWDRIAYNAPNYLIVVSAGNDRNDAHTGQHWHYTTTWGWQLATDNHNADGNYDCISGTSVSKNVLTVGAVYKITDGYSAPSDVSMTDFSAWGPTDDGRIKPDVVAAGYNINSTAAFERPLTDPPTLSTTEYYISQGTSMAAPAVTGSIGLLLQHQNNLNSARLLRSSTMKALVIHTTDEAGTANGPDYKYGWGLMNTLRAAQTLSLSNPCQHLAEYILTQGEVADIIVKSSGTSPLRATTCWIDTAIAPIAIANALDNTTSRLINDLDLRIINTSNSTTYSPWILDPANPGNAATTGDNTRDNVEQVNVGSPSSGTYAVRISHKGNLYRGNQRYSVIITGNDPIDDLTLSNQTLTGSSRRIYRAANTITAGPAFEVQSPAGATFVAGTKITMGAGFRTHTGSRFHAYIKECGNVSLPRPQVLTNDNGAVTMNSARTIALTQSTPNPFSTSTSIEYTLTTTTALSLSVVDVFGKTVATVVSEPEHIVGTFTATLDGTDLPNGMYYWILKANGETAMQKVVLLR